MVNSSISVAGKSIVDEWSCRFNFTDAENVISSVLKLNQLSLKYMVALPLELLVHMCQLVPMLVLSMRLTCKEMRNILEQRVDKTQKLRKMLSMRDVAGALWYTTNALNSGISGVGNLMGWAHSFMDGCYMNEYVLMVYANNLIRLFRRCNDDDDYAEEEIRGYMHSAWLACAKLNDARLIPQLPRVYIDGYRVQDVKDECIKHGSYDVYAEFCINHDYGAKPINDARDIKTMINTSDASDQRHVGWKKMLEYICDVHSISDERLDEHMRTYTADSDSG